MALANHPDKFTADAFSDSTLETYNANGVYNRFTNRFTTPILNAKGVQLLNCNLVNTGLQLNDQNMLMFWYYRSATQNGMRNIVNLRCIRLHPSTFTPYTGSVFTAYVRNAYFNTVAELVAALNSAATTGGDSTTFNTYWSAGDLTFSYNANTRKISVTSATAGLYIAPAAYDDPNILTQLIASPIKMNGYTSSNTYGTATAQPYVAGYTMNQRLGFAMALYTRGLWWNGSSQLGVATMTGVPQIYQIPIEADNYPILVSVQNVQVYLSIATGGGMDSLNGKNLIASIPLEYAPLNICSYTLSSVEKPSLSTPNEIYEVTIEFRDETGLPYYLPPSFNTELSFSVYY